MSVINPNLNVPTSWSYSAWELHELCPLKYYYERVEKRPQPPVPAFERGNKVHGSLARYLKGEDWPLHEDVQNAFQKKLYADIRAIPTGPKQIEQKWGFTSTWLNTGWGPAWFRAICDVSIMYGDGCTEVVDHKTGKPREESDDQMELFALSTNCRFPNDAKEVVTRLVYIDAGTEKVKTYTQSDFVKLRPFWNQRAKMMLEDRQFLPRPNDKCRFCAFSKAKGGPCRFGS